jgi:hypothetical protein
MYRKRGVLVSVVTAFTASCLLTIETVDAQSCTGCDATFEGDEDASWSDPDNWVGDPPFEDDSVCHIDTTRHIDYDLGTFFTICGLDVEGFNLSQTSPEANLIISASTLVIEEGGLIKRDTPDLPYKVIIRAGGGSVWRLGR